MFCVCVCLQSDSKSSSGSGSGAGAKEEEEEEDKGYTVVVSSTKAYKMFDVRPQHSICVLEPSEMYCVCVV
jgi:hypothetical protein